MTGAEVKNLIRSAGVKCWQVADQMGMQDSAFSRRLRKPFDETEVKRIQAIVAKLSANAEVRTDKTDKEAVS